MNQKQKLSTTKIVFIVVSLLVLLIGAIVVKTLVKAAPRYNKIQSRLIQSEAKTNLNNLYLLQEAYYTKNNTYF